MVKILLYFVVSIILHISITSCNVLELDDKFLDVEKDNEWLVMFYAPWCGHCRNLEPTWLEVGSEFHKMPSHIKVARLDASKYTSVASHYGIRGFPSIKFFKDGFQYDYNGARNKHSIISFVTRASGPSVTSISDSKSLDQAKKNFDVFFLYVGKVDDDLYDMYLPITKELFTTISFFSGSKSILPKDVSIRSEPTILVYKDDKFYELPEDLPDADFLKLWISTEQFASYNELTGMTYHLLRAAGRPFAIVALNKDDPFNKTFEAMAYERSHPYMFCWVEGNGIVNRLTSGQVSIPNVLVYDTDSHEYFVMLNGSDSQSLSKESVEEFFQKIKDGVISPLGGSGVIQKIQRFMIDTMVYFHDLFAKKPIVASVIVIVPIILFTAFCVCLCSMSDDQGYVEEDVVIEDELEKDSGGEEQEKDLNEEEQEKDSGEKSKDVEPDPPEDEGANGDRENADESTGLRKRIKDPKTDE